jgi:hypothetical protein
MTYEPSASVVQFRRGRLPLCNIRGASPKDGRTRVCLPRTEWPGYPHFREMSSPEVREEDEKDGRPVQQRPLARLTVVLVSDNVDPRVSLDLLAPRCKALNAELLVVGSPRDNADQSRRELLWPEVRFITAEQGAGEADMRRAGVLAAKGDVIAIRTPQNVGDASWMSAFHHVLGFQPVSSQQPDGSGDRRRRNSYSNEFPASRERRRDRVFLRAASPDGLTKTGQK